MADTLSHLEIDYVFHPATPSDELFALSQEELYLDLPDNAYPLSYKTIFTSQQEDASLLSLLKTSPAYKLKDFSGGRKNYNLICNKEKIVIPATLQHHITQWYHTYLCHPGETRTEKTISQHFIWPNLNKMVKDVCQKCPTCQRKKSTKKYGLLPEKEAETIPWEKLCVDLIGPYKITNTNNNQELTLWCITMIDPATGWLEIKEIKNKEAINIANLVEQT